MIDFAAFADELQKIAAKRRPSGAIYSPGVVAHEAGHAVVHGQKGVTALRQGIPAGANLYGTARLVSRALGAPGISTKEFAAVSALANAPVLADEGISTAIGLKKLRSDKKLSKADWRRTALQLAAINSSYMASPLMDVATLAAAKGGAHPLLQLGMQLAAKPAAGKLWSALGMMVKGPKVDAKRAKEIVQATAPGTPVFAIKQPIPGGSLYVPPVGKNKSLRDMVAASYGGVMGKRDLRTLQSKGGVLLAPLDPKTQAKSLVPGQFKLDSKFRRVT